MGGRVDNLRCQCTATPAYTGNCPMYARLKHPPLTRGHSMGCSSHTGTMSSYTSKPCSPTMPVTGPSRGFFTMNDVSSLQMSRAAGERLALIAAGITCLMLCRVEPSLRGPTPISGAPPARFKLHRARPVLGHNRPKMVLGSRQQELGEQCSQKFSGPG